MATVDITDNTGQVLASMKAQVARALEIIGGKAESYTKALTPVDWTYRLRAVFLWR